MELWKKKAHVLLFNVLLLFACLRVVEMKIFSFPNYSKPCKLIDDDGRCTCDYSYKPCVFEDKSGNSDPYDSYKKCVQVGRTNQACCPPGWSYNKYSVDVNCIGNDETIAGYAYFDRTISTTRKEKGCKWESHPSCRKESIVGNKPTVVHTCQKKEKPCNGRCYDKDDRVCQANQICMSEAMWNYGCEDAITTVNPEDSSEVETTDPNTELPSDASTEPTEIPCFELRYQYIGSLLKMDPEAFINITTVEECQKQCEKEDDCEQFNWYQEEKKCSLLENKQGAVKSQNSITGSKLSKQCKEKSLSTGWIIGLSLLGAFGFFQVCCILHAIHTCRRYKSIQRQQNINIRMKTVEDPGCFWWTLLHTKKYTSGKMLYEIRDHLELQNATVEANPDYGMEEPDYEDELVDYNDYYGDAE